MYQRAMCAWNTEMNASGPQRHVEVERIVPEPPQAAWDRYTDFVSWTDWARLGRVSLAKQGNPAPNGVGCVRVFRLPLGVGNVHEEVLTFEPPSRMTYRILRGGFPVKDHLGEVIFEPHERGTRVVWRCRFDAKVPFTGAAIERVIERVFRRTLSRFARSTPDGRRAT
jgi:uncharacterized protein YndB with AHSA1/START domain